MFELLHEGKPMSPKTIPGYPYPPELHEYLESMVSDVLRMRENAIHPEGHGAGAVILYEDETGIIQKSLGASERDRERNIRICAEKKAFDKLMADVKSGLKVRVIAIGVAAAVRRKKDLLGWIIGARLPCESCRDMLHSSDLFNDQTPVVMVNPNRTLVIHQLGHIREIYDKFPG